MFFKNKKNIKIIKFSKKVPYSEDFLPIKLFMPEWYKNTEPVKIKNLTFDNLDFRNRKNIKNCMPFLDSLTTGYTMVTPFDILVKKENLATFFTWDNSDYDIIASRPKESALLLPIPTGHSEEHFVWHISHDLRLPKKYSAIYMHPLNRHDLPFTTLSGIIDGEIIHAGNIPFFIKNDFEGLIPAGTPYLQVIPFKKEDWSTEKDNELLNLAFLQNLKSKSFLYGWYKKNQWKKSRYE